MFIGEHLHLISEIGKLKNVVLREGNGDLNVGIGTKGWEASWQVVTFIGKPEFPSCYLLVFALDQFLCLCFLICKTRIVTVLSHGY